MRIAHTWFAVALGGALGTLTRAALDVDAVMGGEPDLWRLFLVNFAGAAGLGFVAGHGFASWSTPLKSGVTTGFFGSFTTFSGILAGWLSLTVVGDPLLGILYLLTTFIGGVLVAYGGIEAGGWVADVISPGGGERD